jgi:hypothetical protein
MNALSLITWMQENTLVLMLIVLCFFGLMFGLKTLIFSRLKIDQPDDTRE